MRITKKYLAKWIDEQFASLGRSECKVSYITIYRLTRDQREDWGVYRFAAYVSMKSATNFFKFLTVGCEYSFKELQDHINKGWQLYLDVKDGQWILDLKKA